MHGPDDAAREQQDRGERWFHSGRGVCGVSELHQSTGQHANNPCKHRADVCALESAKQDKHTGKGQCCANAIGFTDAAEREEANRRRRSKADEFCYCVGCSPFPPESAVLEVSVRGVHAARCAYSFCAACKRSLIVIS